MRAWRSSALVVALALMSPIEGAAQEAAPLYLSVSPETGELRLLLGEVLDDPGLVRAVHSGLPLRIRVVAELWRDRLFDSETGRSEWRASVIYDPLDRTYSVATGADAEAQLEVDSIGAVRNALRDAFQIALRPDQPGRYYYRGELEIETLSMSDLEELQRWLQGDLAGPTGEDERVETAVGRGVRRAIVRMLGVPARRIRFRSPYFDISEGGPR